MTAARRAIFHVGLPRTGTTSLQRFLHDRRERLLERGLLYPDLTPASAAEPHLSHQHLGETLDGRRPPAERRELLVRLDAALAATGADVCLLSYEGLCRLPDAARAARELADLVAGRGFAPEILMTVKPQIDLLNSLYTKQIQSLRGQARFAAFLDRSLDGPRLDYLAALQPWAEAADGRVTVVPLHDHRSHASFLTRVFADLGLGERVGDLVAKAGAGLRENPSQGPLGIEIERRMVETGLHHLLAGRERAATRTIEEELARRGLDTEGFVGFDAAMAERVERRWEETNDKLAFLAWGCRWSERVAPGPRGARNELAPVPPPEAEAAIAEVLGGFLAGAGLRPPGRLARLSLTVRAAAGRLAGRLRRRWRCRAETGGDHDQLMTKPD